MGVGESDLPTNAVPICDSLHGAKPFRRRPVRGIGVFVFVENLAPNSLGPHHHEEWQIVIVPPGAAMDISWYSHRRKTANRRIAGGEVWLLPPTWIHDARWREPAEFIVLHVEDAWIRKFHPSLRHEISVARLTEYVAAVPAIADLCRELRRFANVPNGPTDWRVAAVGTHLATALLQSHLMLTNGVFRPPSALVGKLLKKLNTHLKERTGERVPLAKIALRCGVSDRHLRRIFREAMGVSPQEWITAQKVKHAAHLLLEGFNVKEAVERAGFTSESHLHRAMLRVYGSSPSAFRRQAQVSTSPGCV